MIQYYKKKMKKKEGEKSKILGLKKTEVIVDNDTFLQLSPGLVIPKRSAREAVAIPSEREDRESNGWSGKKFLGV